MHNAYPPPEEMDDDNNGWMVTVKKTDLRQQRRGAQSLAHGPDPTRSVLSCSPQGSPWICVLVR